MQKILIVTGMMRIGKTTFIEHFKENCNKKIWFFEEETDRHKELLDMYYSNAKKYCFATEKM
jgi:deoxyadenosine/deoxycytidine kinase